MQEMGGVREGADLVDVASSVAFGMGCIGLILLLLLFFVNVLSLTNPVSLW